MALERFHKLQFYRRNRDIWGLAASSESGGGGLKEGKLRVITIPTPVFRKF